ncbi:MAG: amino acid ABC transporter ATP-binding protein [Clostridiales bacterium]|nr:amino acid ABC transporter ATP-binding protein [Clostridiales bacterium]
MYYLNEVRKSFGNNQVLKGISLTIEPKKTTVLIGPSGSGKTTLLKCMNLLELPDNGTIEMNQSRITFTSARVKKSEIQEIRMKTGMVFQSFQLFPHKTAIENIIEGPIVVLKQSKKKAVEEGLELLEKVGLLEKKDSYPHQLSGGQQQRIAIARALAMKPELLLFDEPTSALDPELEVEVLSIIQKLAKENRTIVIVTHKMSFAREVGNRIVFIDNGEILEEGSYEQLNQSENPRIKQFLNMLN